MKDYSESKRLNQAASALISRHVSASGLDRFRGCGSFLQFKANEDLSVKKLHQGNFCKNRFCPICQRNAARKEAAKIGACMAWVQQVKGKEFILLTLTAPNVTGDKLKAEIDRFNQAFRRLLVRAEVAPIIKGYVRKLEVEHNAERGDYHPHFHVLIAVNKSYFSDKTYLSQAEWLRLWREAMRDETIMNLHVCKATMGANNELAKYVAKAGSLYASQEVFDTFHAALSRRQLLTFNGLFAEASKLFEAGELEEFRKVDTTRWVWLLWYRWAGQDYDEIRREEFSEEKHGAGEEFDD